MTDQTQQAVLQAAKDELGVTWDELAELSDIAPRALKTYRMPPESKDHRTMPKLAFNAIDAAVKKYRNRNRKSV
ncbi:hypothetical protein LPN04_29585 [Rugamonas sp. A1-17]|nr:hypothetical protein [Rugamonas sp. A1-17]